MTTSAQRRGGAPVGLLADLDAVSAASVIYLRMWCNGVRTQADVWNDLAGTLGPQRGRQALHSFEQLCDLCARHGRRPLVRHSLKCKCLGADEACFANFIATAVDGERDDTLLMATLLVRADIAPVIASLATEFGLALKQMNLAAPREAVEVRPPQSTLH